MDVAPWIGLGGREHLASNLWTNQNLDLARSKHNFVEMKMLPIYFETLSLRASYRTNLISLKIPQQSGVLIYVNIKCGKGHISGKFNVWAGVVVARFPNCHECPVASGLGVKVWRTSCELC